MWTRKIFFISVFQLAIIYAFIKVTKQECLQETSYNGIPVMWPASPNGTITLSEPVCFSYNGTTIRRYCNNTTWEPPTKEVQPCMTVENEFDLDGCPPGYAKIARNNTDYCYQITPPASWNYPCFRSGGATVITTLDNPELSSLLASLSPIAKKYWLPGQRQKRYNPVVWSIPGQNWGRPVTGHKHLPLHESIFYGCLVLDLSKNIMTTDSCDKLYPTLCIYVNEPRIPIKCPPGYFAIRFMPDKDSCYGIERSASVEGNTFNEFITNQCPNPVSQYAVGNLGWFVFLKLAEITGLSDKQWCWYQSSFIFNGTHFYPEEEQFNSSEVSVMSFQGMINIAGTIGLNNVLTRLPCMACEKTSNSIDAELSFEYNEVHRKMFLTIYRPFGLWKDASSDKGIQCFSDAKGFVKIVDINDTPYFEVNKSICIAENITTSEVIMKVVYEIDPVTDRSAQYWCEGHSKNFTFLQTTKIIVNPSGELEHVFVLTINTANQFQNVSDDYPTLSQLALNINSILEAKNTLIMDILDINDEVMIVLLHVHVELESKTSDNVSDLILNAYNILISKAHLKFPEYNYTFVNMSSSTRCLPSTTQDYYPLDWEMTPLGHICAPKQFCLQSNGLPVTRHCGGSYTIGAIWQSVDGKCSPNYEASNTTTFLYKVSKGQESVNSTWNFLTKGLGYVFDDLAIIIPADIFYLSMSLQYILRVAKYNDTWIDMGDIYNIAWAMNQVMALDWDYLRLAQSLNSTNVIVDSVNDIIEMITTNNHTTDNKNNIELAVEDNFVVQVSYPLYNNVTGLAVIRETDSDNFTDMTILPLYSNMSIKDVIELKNLEIAAWLPYEVLLTIRPNTNESESNFFPNNKENIHIVISIFNNDSVFQELDYALHQINSRIIGISIPGYISNLEYPVPIIFKEIHETVSQRSCGYWDFNTNSRGTVPGYWAEKGCFLDGNISNLTICQCLHLTHFGQLISKIRIQDNGDLQDNLHHERALNVITLVGCFLSLLGIVGIWITAIVFHSWRQKPGTKVLLQLSASISLPLVLMLIFNMDLGLFEIKSDLYQVKPNKEVICITFGVILHFSILSGFTWMLITAILQFIRYVLVLGVKRPTRFMCKLALVGWGLPLIPVIITLIVDRRSYIPPKVAIESMSVVPLCYPSGLSFYLGVLIPIAIVLLVNVILFVLVLYSISRGPDGKFRKANMDLIGAQLRLSVFLFFLLGLSWLFGFFSFGKNGVLLSYLFCLTSTLQGFVLFIYFVVCDPATRVLWISLMKPQFRSSFSSTTSLNN